MAFPIRSLDEISQRVRGAMRQYLPGSDASLKQNTLYVIGKVVTLLAHEYELRLQWIFRQLFLTTASTDAIVRMHAAEYGVYQKAAAPAAGEVAGTAMAHATYPAGVRYLSAGATYVTSAAFTANALGAFTVPVIAERSGLATNRDAGAELLLADATLYPTLSDRVTVGAGGLGGGADVEGTEALRSRALKRKAAPTQGVALLDYENWAMEVPGVSAVWAAQFANGFGSIGAWVLFHGRMNGIPTESDLAAVNAHIVDRRLVRARFDAVAPVAKPVDLTIRITPDTARMRAAAFASLNAFFDAAAPGARLRPGLPDNPFVLPLAWISEVVSATDDEVRHTVIAPGGDLTFQPGELPVLGTITWA